MSDLKKILYVEDEPDIRFVVDMALRGGGFEVECCGTGREAIEKAPVFRPDMLLLDVMMPVMDGPATLQALRRMPATASTPAVFMTAKIQAEEILQYEKIGVVDIVAKPFDPMTLVPRLLEIWASKV